MYVMGLCPFKFKLYYLIAPCVLQIMPDLSNLARKPSIVIESTKLYPPFDPNEPLLPCASFIRLDHLPWLLFV